MRRDLTDRVLGTVQLSGVFVPRWGRHPVPDPHMHIVPPSVRALRDGPENARARPRARRAHMHTERSEWGRVPRPEMTVTSCTLKWPCISYHLNTHDTGAGY